MNRFALTAFLIVASCASFATGCAKHDDASSASSDATASSDASTSPDASASPDAGTGTAPAGETAAPAATSDAAATTAGASPSPSLSPSLLTGSPVAAAAASPDPQGTSVTMTSNGKTVTIGTADTLKGTDLPIYPNATAVNGGIISTTADGVKSVVATMTSNDNFGAVDGWYKSHIDASYKATHLAMGPVENSTYKSGDENAPPFHAIVITTNGKSTSGSQQTSIMVIEKEKMP